MANGGRPSIAVLAPTGWSVRDFVGSPFLRALASDAEVVVLTPRPEALEERYGGAGVSFARMEVEPLDSVSTTAFKAFEYANFYRQGTTLHRWLLARRSAGPSLRWRAKRLAVKAAARTLSVAPAPLLERAERALLGLRAESRRVEAVLREHEVDLVLSTMPLIAHYERPTLWAAGRLGIPRVAFITSWDNLYSKGRLPVRFDHHLVWSEHMGEELRGHYPSIAPDRIEVVGAPQFDHYFRPELRRGREEFLRGIGADPARPLILWSGVSPGQFPGEPQVVGRAWDLLRELEARPQLLLRPHPIGGGARFADVRRRHPDILFTETNDSDPLFLVQWEPQDRDLAVLVNSVSHCDVNVNHCSTMTLDACLCDRPVVNIAFGPEPGGDEERALRACYDFDHYRTIVDRGATRVVEDVADLVEQVRAYLADPARDRDARAAALGLQCGRTDGRTFERIAGALHRLAWRATRSAGAAA